jgi:phosphoglycerol transferase MdoB-like AlkP superfamily enzyme
MKRIAIGGRGLEWTVLLVAFLATWPIELALGERKYGFLGGGFGQSHALDGAAQIGGFLIATALAQAVLLGLLYLAIGRAIRAPARREERLLAFLFVGAGVANLALAAKLELLSYFSDAVSFQLLRNLGGGSLVDAALFGLSESALYAVALVGALVLFLAARWWLRRRSRARAVVPDAQPAFGWRGWSLLVAATVLVVFAADRVRNVRLAAHRMNAYALLSDGLNQLTDVDRDGFGLFGPEIDRQPFDATRYPFALDVPGDGIDQDGLAGDLVAPPPPAPYRAPALPARPRHLILVVLESTRAGLLDARVNVHWVAPNLRALAAEGSHVREAYSHVGFTTESLKSLFTGQLAPEGPRPSLFRDLKAAGYRVAVFSGQPEGFGDIDAVVGERASSDVYVDASTLKDERATAFAAQGSLLVDEGKLLAAFDRRLGDPAGWRRPTFAYFNFQSAHFPYHHDGMVDLVEPRPLPRGQIDLANRDRVARTYWNAVAYADHRLGELIARLKSLGQWNDTLLVVTADHGESLFDDGFLGHGHLINDQQTHIPLVLSQPGVDPRGPVGLSDYRALILNLLAGRPTPRSPGAVFQYIGDLDRPAQIGLVEPGGRWTIFDFDTGDVRFLPGGKPVTYATLPAGSPARTRADRLIHRWETERWRHHAGR